MTTSKITAISEALRARNNSRIIEITSDVIASTLEGTSRCQACIDGSFSHRLGFEKFVLIDEGVDGQQLRIHCWRPEAVEMPHDHPWSFGSFVLSGQLLNTEYRRSSSGEVYERRIARSDFSTNGFSYRPAADQMLTVVHRRRVAAGGLYFMEADAIHATRVIAGPAVTVFLRSSVLRYESSTYAFKGPSTIRSTPREFRPPAFSSARYLEGLAEVREILASARHPSAGVAFPRSPEIPHPLDERGVEMDESLL